MSAYAVIETGGKQYRVTEGDIVDVELLGSEAGDTYVFENILAVSDGETLKTGSPLIEGAAVQAEVLENRKGPKLVAFKKKRRKGYTRKVGHRQKLTRVKITGLGA